MIFPELFHKLCLTIARFQKLETHVALICFGLDVSAKISPTSCFYGTTNAVYGTTNADAGVGIGLLKGIQI